jgi:hypothetical protein
MQLLVRSNIMNKLFYHVIFSLSLMTFIYGCNENPDEYNYLRNENIEQWLSSNKKELDVVINKLIEIKHLSRVSSCPHINKSSIKYLSNFRKYSTEIEHIGDLLKKIKPPNNEECFEVIVSTWPKGDFYKDKKWSDFQAGDHERIISALVIPIISDGGCIPSGQCKNTGLSFVPDKKHRDRRMYPFRDINGNYETIYTKLNYDGWYISR